VIAAHLSPENYNTVKVILLMLSLIAALVALPQPARAAKPIIVGDGTAASCTETPLVSALVIAGATDGGTIKFKCGGGPVTIAQTATLSLPNNTTIDGGGLITLDGGARLDPGPCSLIPPLAAGVTVASVDGTATVALKNLTIYGGGLMDWWSAASRTRAR
jgi:hypothetical protein